MWTEFSSSHENLAKEAEAKATSFQNPIFFLLKLCLMYKLQNILTHINLHVSCIKQEKENKAFDMKYLSAIYFHLIQWYFYFILFIICFYAYIFSACRILIPSLLFLLKQQWDGEHACMQC